jgi:adenosylcobyric acid synthase
VTVDGGEIGRAQALQAQACGLDPVVDMNPVLLKPETDTGAQVIVQGKRFATMKARDYGKAKADLMPRVLESFHRLGQGYDLVIVEGAGSPAEVNLRAGDIANMGFAEAADLPVILAGDIDRGGVIAQLVGTHVVLPPNDRARIKAFLVNKFRGDPTLFSAGAAEIARHTGWHDLGTLPWFGDAWRLPAEDVMDISTRAGGAFKIAVPRLNRIANFDDLDPLVNEPNVTVEIIEPGRPLPGDASLVLIPGSKSTIADLNDFRAQGWDIDLSAHLRRGGHVLGICGGYQILGKKIIDEDGIEGPPCKVDGLGHLDIVTRLKPKKTLALTHAKHIASDHDVQGYEIHLGHSEGPDCSRAWLRVGESPEGAASPNGRVLGCYLHGLFSADLFRKSYLEGLGAQAGEAGFDARIEDTLDHLASHLETHLDIDQILKISGSK